MHGIEFIFLSFLISGHSDRFSHLICFIDGSIAAAVVAVLLWSFLWPQRVLSGVSDAMQYCCSRFSHLYTFGPFPFRHQHHHHHHHQPSPSVALTPSLHFPVLWDTTGYFSFGFCPCDADDGEIGTVSPSRTRLSATNGLAREMVSISGGGGGGYVLIYLHRIFRPNGESIIGQRSLARHDWNDGSIFSCSWLDGRY